MSIYADEIFGPVLTVVRADDFEEALALPSENIYGNGVAIFTRDGDTAREFTRRVNVGMVGVNVPIPVPIAYYTFGGWKASGFGDLNQHGADAFKFVTRTKTVTSRWPSGVKEEASFVMPLQWNLCHKMKFLTSVEGSLGVITLNRPKAVNAVNPRYDWPVGSRTN